MSTEELRQAFNAGFAVSSDHWNGDYRQNNLEGLEREFVAWLYANYEELKPNPMKEECLCAAIYGNRYCLLHREELRSPR